MASGWRRPWPAWATVLLATGLLVARKPWALGTPQLWAEDGPIHLAGNDEFGARALFLPYRGYLHLLPRAIAWAASHVADVAHWPAIYNWAAFLVTVALFARLASSRIALPGQPWLVLSLVVAAHTGEVWFNITNLHWLTAFFIVAQILITRPVTPAQRCADLAILAVIGLTGPFVVVFLPMLAWRWWRDRHADNFAVLLTAGACAAVQIYFITRTNLQLPPQARALNVELLLAVTGSRLVVWPVLGEEIAAALAWTMLGAIGLTFIVVVLGWALRPDPRRLLRTQIVVMFVAITSVCVWRVRPDTWAYPDLINGDSYFYIARILLVWLVILEFDARPKAVAFTARAVCIAGLLMELPHYRLPAPPDYHWAAYCDAIRRGEPAKIPTLPVDYVFDYGGRPNGAHPRATAVLEVAGRITHFSILTRIAATEPSFTVGIVLGGAGVSGVKPLVVRAVGPSLAALGVTDGLPDPLLKVSQDGRLIATNDNWEDQDGVGLAAASARVGTFPILSPDSRDAALLLSSELPPAVTLTMEVSGHGAAGTVLAELYDATPPGDFTRTTPRVVNFSALKQISAGDTLAVSVVVSGVLPQRVLVRVVGPTLRTTFGLGGAMADPKFELFDERRNSIALNNDWGGGKKLTATFTEVGAFKLDPASKDAALEITLPPGRYTVQASGRGDSSGVVLVEFFELP